MNHQPPPVVKIQDIKKLVNKETLLKEMETEVIQFLEKIRNTRDFSPAYKSALIKNTESLK